MSNRNPYKHWLGLSVEAPNYFELLSVDPDTADNEAVTDAAKTALKRMGDRPPEGQEKIWRRLRTEIKVAYECLKEPVSRSSYLQEIRSADEKRLHQTPDDDAALTVVGLEETTENFDELPPRADIPMAEIIPQPPMGAPVQAAVVVAPPPVPQAPPGPAIKTEGHTIQRSSSGGWLVPILLAVVGLGSAAAAAVWWFNNQRGVDRTEWQSDSDESRTDSPAGNLGDEQSDVSSNQDSEDVDRIDEALSGDALNSDALNSDALNSDALNGDTLASDAPNSDLSVGENSNDGSGELPNPDVDTARPPSSAEEYALVRCLREAAFGVTYRDWHWTEEKLSVAASLAKTAKGRAAFERLVLVSENYHQLWSELEQAARDLEALDEIEVSDTIVSITEIKPDELVYRFKGERRASPYAELPVALALAIYERNRDAQDPDVLVARAALYSVVARSNTKSRGKARQALTEAKQSRVRVDSLSGFMTDRYSDLAPPRNQRPLPNRQEKLMARSALGDQLPDASVINQISSEQAIKVATDLILAADAQTDEAQKYMLLNAAIEAGVRSKDAFVLFEALNEKMYCFLQSPAELLGKMTALSRETLDEQQLLRFARVCSHLGRRFEARRQIEPAKKIRSLGKQIAQDAGADYWADRLQRELDSITDQ